MLTLLLWLQLVQVSSQLEEFLDLSLSIPSEVKVRNPVEHMYILRMFIEGNFQDSMSCSLEGLPS
jgi:hypothetical protein